MSINETSKLATRKQLSFKVLDLVYTPTLNGFIRSDGLVLGFLDILILSIANPDVTGTLIEE